MTHFLTLKGRLKLPLPCLAHWRQTPLLISGILISLGLFIASCSESNSPDEELNISADHLETMSTATSAAGKTITVDDPKYFQTHLNNTASVYLINVPLVFKSNTTVKFGSKSRIKPGPKFPSSQKHSMFNLFNLKNTTIKGGIIDGSEVQDGILITGGSTQAIKLEGIRIENARRFGIQVYGVDSKNKPNNIDLISIKTVNCRTGGIHVNSAHNIRIKFCNNDGGLRGIGIESPIPANNGTTLPDEKRYSRDIEIYFCKTKNNTEFGIQLLYTKNVSISRCRVDGTKIVKGDKSCITIDRAKNTVLSSDTTINGLVNNVFITGSYSTTVKNNYATSTVKTPYLIQAFYNFEAKEDRVIKESKDLTLINNRLIGGKIGIMLNGAQNVSVADNALEGITNKDIYIMSQTRTFDGLLMKSKKITIDRNKMRNRIFFNNDLKPEISLLKLL